MSPDVINWKTAPKGATHFFPSDVRHPWRKLEGEIVSVYEYGEWRSINVLRSMLCEYIERPVLVEQWDGTGLPPTGLLVEWSEGYGSKVRRVTVLAYANGDAWIQPEGAPSLIVGNPAGFRPIRTPEQIAADEREHAVRNACTDIAGTLEPFKDYIPSANAALEVVRALIDAGYSKEPKGLALMVAPCRKCELKHSVEDYSATANIERKHLMNLARHMAGADNQSKARKVRRMAIELLAKIERSKP